MPTKKIFKAPKVSYPNNSLLKIIKTALTNARNGSVDTKSSQSGKTINLYQKVEIRRDSGKVHTKDRFLIIYAKDMEGAFKKYKGKEFDNENIPNDLVIQVYDRLTKLIWFAVPETFRKKSSKKFKQPNENKYLLLSNRCSLIYMKNIFYDTFHSKIDGHHNATSVVKGLINYMFEESKQPENYKEFSIHEEKSGIMIICSTYFLTPKFNIDKVSIPKIKFLGSFQHGKKSRRRKSTNNNNNNNTSDSDNGGSSSSDFDSTENIMTDDGDNTSDQSQNDTDDNPLTKSLRDPSEDYKSVDSILKSPQLKSFSRSIIENKITKTAQNKNNNNNDDDDDIDNDVNESLFSKIKVPDFSESNNSITKIIEQLGNIEQGFKSNEMLKKAYNEREEFLKKIANLGNYGEREEYDEDKCPPLFQKNRGNITKNDKLPLAGWSVFLFVKYLNGDEDAEKLVESCLARLNNPISDIAKALKGEFKYNEMPQEHSTLQSFAMAFGIQVLDFNQKFLKSHVEKVCDNLGNLKFNAKNVRKSINQNKNKLSSDIKKMKAFLLQSKQNNQILSNKNNIISEQLKLKSNFINNLKNQNIADKKKFEEEKKAFIEKEKKFKEEIEKLKKRINKRSRDDLESNSIINNNNSKKIELPTRQKKKQKKAKTVSRSNSIINNNNNNNNKLEIVNNSKIGNNNDHYNEDDDLLKPSNFSGSDDEFKSPKISSQGICNESHDLGF